MKNVLVGSLLLFSVCSNSCGQPKNLQQSDSSNFIGVQPNSLIAIANLSASDGSETYLEILEIKSQGQGLVNIVSPGDKITVTLATEYEALIDQTVEVHLKEELGTDASKTTYRIIGLRKAKG